VIEVFEVEAPVLPDVSIVPRSSAVTVAGASSDVMDAVGQGVIASDQVAVVRGDSGWDEAASVIGDSYRLRERNFGRVHDAEGAVLSIGEPRHGHRRVTDYPANPGAEPVVARYEGVEYVNASSSQAFTDGFGEVRPENAPLAAVDDDPLSAWRTGFLESAEGQWLEVHLSAVRDLGVMRVTSAVSNPVLGEVLEWRVDAQGRSQRFEVDPLTGIGQVDLTGVRTDEYRLTVVRTRASDSLAPISVLDVDVEGPQATRSLVLPEVPTTASPTFTFTARPEVRTCIPTLLGPDCDFARGRRSDESSSMTRTFHLSEAGSFRLTGTVVARADAGAQQLLDPLGGPGVVHASSTLAADPTVSARMAYDGNGSTTWMSDPYDPTPTLTVEFQEPRTLSRIGVGQPGLPAVSPTIATVSGNGEKRTVKLGDFGAFSPLRAKTFTIELQNPTRGLAPIGMSELFLGPKGLTLPFDGSAETGAVCGLGPAVEVDGRRYDTRVSGFMGSVLSAGPMNLALCDDAGSGDEELLLGAGTHEISVQASTQFQPIVTQLAPANRATPAPTEVRTARVDQGGSTSQNVEIGPGEASVLRTTRNFNAGWVAELDGERLRSQRVDGWAQGWLVPAGEGGTIEITFAPQKPFIVGLIAGLVAAGLSVLLALAMLIRTRRGPAVQPGPPVGWARVVTVTPLVGASCLAGVLLVAWLLGGLAALVGGLLAASLLAARRSRLRHVADDVRARQAFESAAGVLMVSGPIVTALALHLDHGPNQPWADLLAGAGFFVLVGLMAIPEPSPSGSPTNTS
jgi:arabinofuranan 3-O-arabinosyltransferase